MIRVVSIGHTSWLTIGFRIHSGSQEDLVGHQDVPRAITGPQRRILASQARQGIRRIAIIQLGTGQNDCKLGLVVGSVGLEVVARNVLDTFQLPQRVARRTDCADTADRGGIANEDRRTSSQSCKCEGRTGVDRVDNYTGHLVATEGNVGNEGNRNGSARNTRCRHIRQRRINRIACRFIQPDLPVEQVRRRQSQGCDVGDHRGHARRDFKLRTGQNDTAVAEVDGSVARCQNSVGIEFEGDRGPAVADREGLTIGNATATTTSRGDRQHQRSLDTRCPNLEQTAAGRIQSKANFTANVDPTPTKMDGIQRECLVRHHWVEVGNRCDNLVRNLFVCVKERKHNLLIETRKRHVGIEFEPDNLSVVIDDECIAVVDTCRRTRACQDATAGQRQRVVGAAAQVDHAGTEVTRTQP